MKKKDVWNVFKGCSLAFFGCSFYHIYHIFTGMEKDGAFDTTLLLEARLAGNYVASSFLLCVADLYIDIVMQTHFESPLKQ